MIPFLTSRSLVLDFKNEENTTERSSRRGLATSLEGGCRPEGIIRFGHRPRLRTVVRGEGGEGSMSDFDGFGDVIGRGSDLVPEDEQVLVQALPKQPIHAERSEERRVGKECRSRWSPYH